MIGLTAAVATSMRAGTMSDVAIGMTSDMMAGTAIGTTTGTIAGAVDAWAVWVAALSWQLVPLALIVWLLDRACVRLGPVVQSALWWLVLAKLLVPPGLAFSVSVSQAWPVSVSQLVASSLPPRVAAMVPDAGVQLPRQPREASGGVGAAAFAAWAIGVAAAAGVARWRYRRLRAQCLAGSRPVDAGVERIARAAATRLGLATLPAIRVGPGVARPAVLGFFRPIVMLPTGLVQACTLVDAHAGIDMSGGVREASADLREAHAPHESTPGDVALEHVLLHELAHVRRRDPLASLVCLCAQIVCWFHPAIWYARRRLATLREMQCDHTVARTLGAETADYRRTLILLARRGAAAWQCNSRPLAARTAAGSAAIGPGPGALGPGALGLFERRSQLVARLDLLSKPITLRRRTECVASVALALGVGACCLPMGSAGSGAAAAAAATTAAAPRVDALPAASFDMLPLDRLPGSLQKRYAVMRALALEEQARTGGGSHR